MPCTAMLCVPADVTARGDCITWLHAGTTSKGADSAAGRAVAKLEVALQDCVLPTLQTDRL